jgi:NAD-dependent dihydropyrimidine dehydrogenase PreA subunit
MNRVSRRALVNFVVDSIIAAAFLVSAVSGLVFLLPASWMSLGGAAGATALGVAYTSWRTLHDWSAVIMIAGVVLHTALHWRWVTTMVRRLSDGRVEAGPATRHAAQPAAAAVTDAPASAPARSPVPKAEWSRSEYSGMTRHAFLKRAGAVGAAAVVGGLVGRSVAGTLLNGGASPSTTSAAQESASSLSSNGTGTAGGWGNAGSSAGQAQQTPTQTARVVVDPGSCVGCGACLQACPYGVFAWDGNAATASDPDACRLCGRCVQACRPGAITLSA